jgi:hypothetical protein
MARQQREEIAAARGWRCGRVGADNDCAKELGDHVRPRYQTSFAPLAPSMTRLRTHIE